MSMSKSLVVQRELGVRHTQSFEWRPSAANCFILHNFMWDIHIAEIVIYAGANQAL